MATLSDAEIDAILGAHVMVKHTLNTVTNKNKFREMIQKIRNEGVAIDREELYEGIWAVATVFQVSHLRTHGVIWAVGLEARVSGSDIWTYAGILKNVCSEIEDSLFKMERGKYGKDN